MTLGQLLKKHYLASLLLMVSIASAGYGYWSIRHETKNILITPSTATTSTPNTTELSTIPSKKKIVEQLITPQTSLTSTFVSEQVTTSVQLDGTHAIVIINNQQFPVFVVAYSSVYDALRQLDTNQKISVKFKNYSGLGYFVDGINGQNSDTIRGTYWIYYINGTKAQVGISNYFLKPNDIITWKYENQE